MFARFLRGDIWACALATCVLLTIGFIMYGCENTRPEPIADSVAPLKTIQQTQQPAIADLPKRADAGDRAANAIVVAVPATIQPHIAQPIASMHEAMTGVRNDAATLSATQPQITAVVNNVEKLEKKSADDDKRIDSLQRELDSQVRKDCDRAIIIGIAVCALGGGLIYLGEVWAAILCFIVGGTTIALSIFVVWVAPWIPLIVIGIVGALAIYYIVTHKSIITNLIRVVEGAKEAMHLDTRKSFFGVGASVSPAVAITTPATKAVVAKTLGKPLVPTATPIPASVPFTANFPAST